MKWWLGSFGYNYEKGVCKLKKKSIKQWEYDNRGDDTKYNYDYWN